MISIIQIRRLRIKDVNEFIQPAGRRIRLQIQPDMTQTYYLFSTEYATQLQDSYSALKIGAYTAVFLYTIIFISFLFFHLISFLITAICRRSSPLHVLSKCVWPFKTIFWGNAFKQKYSVSHMDNFKFSTSHLKKDKKKQANAILVFYLPNVSAMLSF